MPGWTHRITLNGVDITAQTALGVTIDEIENGSHTCALTWFPPSGTQSSEDLKLQPIVIEADVGSGLVRLFSGRVLRADWDARTRSYALRASNQLQEHFRGLGSQAAVLAALPGALYSDALFGDPPEDLWEFAQRCMETLEQDVHLDRNGALVLRPWAAKGTADFFLSKSNIDNSVDPRFESIAPEELVNRITIEYRYRVQRKKVRKHTITWSAWANNTNVDSWCDYMVGPLSQLQFELPWKSHLEGILTGGSWNVPGPISWTTHPPSASNLCGVTWVWQNIQSLGEYEVTGFGADGFRAFTQSIWEKYTLQFDALQAQSAYGVVINQAKNAVRDIPLTSDWPPPQAQPQTGWATDPIGDSYEDQEDDDLRVNDLNASQQWAYARIRGGQRGHGVTVRTDLRPDIRLEHTVDVSVFDLQAKGKVRRLRHTLTAAPSTDVTVAISRGGGGSTTPWATPVRPDSLPSYQPPAGITNLITHIGNFSEAPVPPDPDDRLGWITNVDGTGQDGTNPNQIAFNLQWPEIEEEAAAELEPQASSTWELAVDQDVLDFS